MASFRPSPTSLACLLLIFCSLLSKTVAFVVHSPSVARSTTTSTRTVSLLKATPLLDSTAATTASSYLPSSLQSAATVDPTAALSNLLGSFLGSPAVLAIPIVAALGVATLIAFLIVSYAQPAVDDDE